MVTVRNNKSSRKHQTSPTRSLTATDAAHHNGNDKAGIVVASSHPITPTDTLVRGSRDVFGGLSTHLQSPIFDVCARVDNAVMQGCVNAKGKEVFVSKGPGVARSVADGPVELPHRKGVKNRASRVSGSGRGSPATTTS